MFQAVTKSGIETLYLYDGANRLKVMLEFLERVVSSERELQLPDYVTFSTLVSVQHPKSDECSFSYIFARASAFNINETEFFSPFFLQHELVNLAELMLYEHHTGLKGFDPQKPGPNNTYRNQYIIYFEGRLREMLKGTSRLSSVNVRNRVTAAMSLICRPQVRMALLRLTRRPLPEFS